MTALGVSSDGRRVAIAGVGHVVERDLRTGRVLRSISAVGEVSVLGYDGEVVVVHGNSHGRLVLEQERGEAREVARANDGAVTALAVDREASGSWESRVFTRGADGVLRAWDRSTGRELRAFRD